MIAPGPDSIGTASGTTAIDEGSISARSTSRSAIRFSPPMLNARRSSCSTSVRSAFVKKITPPMIWNAGTVMPKNLKTQLPARRNSARTAMHAIDATRATFARPARDTRSVSATNDGITASGLTIVTSVTKETRSTFDSGMNR